jgi:hypothetical protein
MRDKNEQGLTDTQVQSKILATQMRSHMRASTSLS